jgi:serine/threonine protein kinase
MFERNWSGRGQHAEFERNEKPVLASILQVRDTLGSSSTAIVESVKCKRILLARKTIRCGRQLSKDNAINEVAHLNRLNHSHVVQVIGTYIIENDLSILLYPAAEYNLDSFILDLNWEGPEHNELELQSRMKALGTFFSCLSCALSYIHSQLTKHMDLKPKSILVRQRSGSTIKCMSQTLA